MPPCLTFFKPGHNAIFSIRVIKGWTKHDPRGRVFTRGIHIGESARWGIEGFNPRTPGNSNCSWLYQSRNSGDQVRCMIAWRLEYKGQWKLQVYICRTRLGLKSPVCHFVDNYTDTPKIQYNAIQCNTIQYNTIQYTSSFRLQCNAMQYNNYRPYRSTLCSKAHSHRHTPRRRTYCDICKAIIVCDGLAQGPYTQ